VKGNEKMIKLIQSVREHEEERPLGIPRCRYDNKIVLKDVQVCGTDSYSSGKR
jgi:hypothetical protein